jgi:hypothetical protein
MFRKVHLKKHEALLSNHEGLIDRSSLYVNFMFKDLAQVLILARFLCRR